MKRGRKAERDTALWLNDEQESLLEEHKRRIKQQGEQRRTEQERCRTEQRRVEQQRSKEAEEAREKEKDRLFEAIKARAESNTRLERERKQQDEQRRAEREKQQDEQRRADQEKQQDEQRRERKRQEDQKRKWRRFSNLSEKAMNPKVNACFPLPKLNEDDIRLIEEWNQSPQNNLDRKSLIEGESKDWELGRLLSARSAEKIATDFYQSYGKTVEDISITQIDENNNSENPDWKDYDLNVDGCLIDVKNSRKSRNSEDRYTEYCIPRFKTGRRTNQEVRIAGVFSPYLWAFELLDKPVDHHQNREIQFLGETNLEKQQALKREFSDDDLVVDFSESNRSNKYFLPPWVFDYPEYVYTERDKARKELKCFPNLTLLKDRSDVIPVAIAAGIDVMEILDKGALEHWEWSFLNQLSDRIEEYGLLLPFLFLTILKHFLYMATLPKTGSDFKPEDYRKFLFYEGSNSLDIYDPLETIFLFYEDNNPLGIYDPLETIDALIRALAILWTAENGLIRKFSRFRLRSFNILQGKSNPDENSWTTLVAYCGRHQPPCGKNPLVLGESDLCECRRLICPDCGFCCEDEWECRCKRKDQKSANVPSSGADHRPQPIGPQCPRDRSLHACSPEDLGGVSDA